MVVKVPQHDSLARNRWLIGTGCNRISGRPAQYIVSRHGFVASVQYITMPLAVENTLHPAGLVSAVLIHLPPARRRPADDLDLDVIRLFDQAAVTADTVIARHDQRHIAQRQGRLVCRVKQILGSGCRHGISAYGRAGASARRCGQAQTNAHADI